MEKGVRVNILIVEDDELLSDQISMLLKKERYSCDVASNYSSALELYEQNSYQLLLLDWNLPDGSGIELLKAVRDYGDGVSVLMLSGRESIDERVQALDIGADDYLCKPYSNMELLARIRALLRREKSQKVTQLKWEDVLLDTSTRDVRVDGKLHTLTEKEFALLELLMLHKNKVLSRDEISELLERSFDAIKSSNFIDVHVKNIRKKLQRPAIITAVRGIGYAIKE